MGAVWRRLSYANVVATLALFLALSGGVVWAAGRITTKKIKANAVTAGKIKRNAVTGVKIRANAVTGEKIKAGSISFAKFASGANLLLSATSPPVSAAGAEPISVPLSGVTSFTPVAGTIDLLSVEAKGTNLGRVGTEECKPRIVPFVNGSEWDIAEGTLRVEAFDPSAAFPTGLRPLSGGTGPIGLTSPGVTQTIAVKLFGDPACTPTSTVTVAIAVTQLK